MKGQNVCRSLQIMEIHAAKFNINDSGALRTGSSINTSVVLLSLRAYNILR